MVSMLPSSLVLWICGLGLFGPSHADNLLQEVALEQCIPDNSSSAFRAFRTENCVCGGTVLRMCGAGFTGKELVCTGMERFPMENASFPAVHCLIIAHSEFKELNASQIMQFPNLTGLIITDSRLERVQPQALDKLNSLTHLILSNNRLTSVPQISHSRLSFMDVSKNMITSVTNTTFHRLSHLDILDMSDNRIEELRGAVFSGTCQLTALWLSDNPLKRIDDNVFDGANVEQLHLSRTDVRAIPQSLHFRSRIRHLELDGANGLRTFNALSTKPNDNYSDVTYPFLRTVAFPYHAHCCQLKQLGIKYRDIPSNRTEITVNFIAPTVTTPTLEDGIVCVNRSSQQCVSNSSLDLIDESLATFLNNATEFCSAVKMCDSCVQRVCECATPTSPVGSGDGSEVLPNSPPLLCFNPRIEPTPTITPGSIPVPETVSPSQVAHGTIRFTATVEQTLCATTSCVPTATPMATLR